MGLRQQLSPSILSSQSLLETELDIPTLEQILCVGQKHQRTRMDYLEPRSCNVAPKPIIFFSYHFSLHVTSLRASCKDGGPYILWLHL